MKKSKRQNTTCDHIWHRTNAVTTEDGCDTYKCTKCPAIGKSYGLGGSIHVDSGRTRRKKRYYSQTAEYRRKMRERAAQREKRLAEIKAGIYLTPMEWSRREYEKRQG